MSQPLLKYFNRNSSQAVLYWLIIITTSLYVLLPFPFVCPSSASCLVPVSWHLEFWNCLIQVQESVRTPLLLKREGIIISEKIVRSIMKEENLIVRIIRQKKYSSYLGEISPAVPNEIQRDFHADKPNKKWLTDITEFKIGEGKVYLSPIIDCFDGMPITWTVGTSPNAELVNTMLDNAIVLLKENEHPIVHSDRGCHYR